MLDLADGFSILDLNDDLGPAVTGMDLPTAKAEPVDGSVIATANDYRELIAGLVARRHELGLAQHVVDDIAGFTTAYTSKLEAHMKGLGRMSLEALIGTLGVKLVLVRTTPHHLRQRRVMGAACGPVRHGPAPADSRVA